MKSHDDKKILYSLLGLSLIVGFLGGNIDSIHSKIARYGSLNMASAIETMSSKPAPSVSSPHLSLGFVGDIMMDRNVRSTVVSNFAGDYSKLFTNADFLQKPDIMFANLEGPASDKGSDMQNLYSFRMDPKSIIALKDAGVDVVSFANNHVGDWGRPAFEDTLKRLSDAGILSCGAGLNKAQAQLPAIVEQNGIKVGYICFSDVGPKGFEATNTKSGVLMASDPDFDSIITNATKNVDFLVVSFHFGVEYQTNHTARQEALAKKAINDGAGIVVGAHPHVAEEISQYNGTPILYSLGNFIFDQPFSKETMSGLFVTADLNGNEISNVKPHKVILDKNFVPSLDIQN